MAYNKKEVLQANTEAIRVVLRLEKERREATEAEKSILRNYQGFGGLKCVLNRTDNPDDIRYWSKSEQNLFEPIQQLKQMIYREAVDANTAKRYWESIKASVLTSFYTDTRIVSAISDALASTNLQIRRCLDPSMGMGAFAETFANQAGVVDAMEKDLLGIYNTCIVCVLHFVPNGIKLRGHIGSELQRKAAGILSIEKDDNPEYSVVKALKVRDGSPLDVPMMLFGWDKTEDMHVYRGEKSKEDKEKRKTDELLLVIKSAFRTKLRLSYQELCEVLMYEMEIKDRTAKKYIAYMKEQRILTQDTSGNYQKGELCHT